MSSVTIEHDKWMSCWRANVVCFVTRAVIMSVLQIIDVVTHAGYRATFVQNLILCTHSTSSLGTPETWMWNTLHTAFDRSSGTVCTVSGGGCGRHRLAAICGRDYCDDRRSNKLSQDVTKLSDDQQSSKLPVHQFLLNSSQTRSRVDLLYL